ncbi:S-layer homology domain-containing protein [Anaerobacillus sp. MEB173]|uniref:S-layer homology domain-containing protein n=1 Tax=Anaerobacillus sp. MEB173 TaxID=3383345 RepID=UPI003F8DD756
MAYQPKSYRKFLATSVAAAMVATGASAVAADSSFPDVTSGIWYADAVDYLVGKEAIKGFPDGTFKPSEGVTRAQAAQILVDAFGLEVSENPTLGFSDTKNDAWYSAAVEALVEAGIVEGFPNGTFQPNATITRAQLAKMVVELYELEADADVTIPFTDTVKGAWYEAAVNTLYSLGVVEGTTKTTFAPNATVTRAQAAVFVHRTEVEEVRVELPAPPAPAELAVASVSAINSKQIQIKFNKAVEKTTVVDTSDDTLQAGNITLSRVPLATAAGELDKNVADFDDSKAELSSDGKTLTLTAPTTQYFDGTYAIAVTKAVTDELGNEIKEFTSTFTSKDTTRPTLGQLTYKNVADAVVAFSEPVKPANSAGVTFEFKRADGKSFNSNTTLDATKVSRNADDISKFNVDLSALDPADRDKDIVMTIVGVSDYNGNLISPNPTTVTLKYNTTDSAEAKVESITRTGTNKVEILFDRDLSIKPTVDIGSVTVTAANVEIDKDNKKKVVVTLDASTGGDFETAGLPTGLTTVVLDDFAGANLVTPENAVSRVVNLTVSDVKPKVETAVVQKINGVEHLIVTYDKEVQLANYGASTDTPRFNSNNITSAKKTKDYVTSGVTLVTTGVTTNVQNEVFVSLHGVSSTATKSKQIKINLKNLEKADYSITLPEGIVTDLFSNVSAEKKDINFKRDVDSTSNKPEVTAVNQVTNNTVEVLFDREVDGSSAINANYSIEGASIKKVELTSNTATARVLLTLNDDSVTTSGNKTITVSGVKSKAGVLMDSKTTSVNLVENVRPTVTLAELTDTNEITLTFSEAIDATTIDGNNGVDFKIEHGTTAYTGTVEAAAHGTNDKKIVITVGTAFTVDQLNAGLKVKTGTNFDIKDTAGNKANFSSIEVK